MSGAQIKYNKIHSILRSTVQYTFGLLKGHFRRLHYINNGDVNCLSVANCVLDNRCIMSGDEIGDSYPGEDIKN